MSNEPLLNISEIIVHIMFNDIKAISLAKDRFCVISVHQYYTPSHQLPQVKQ
jgi:hypothetical protein